MEQRDLVDIAEAERITGLDKSTIYKLGRSGRLRSYKVLTALRFNRADLQALVRERVIPPDGVDESSAKADGRALPDHSSES